MRKDPVERQVRGLIGKIPPVLEQSGVPMTIRQIAGALGHHTNTPWCVAFAVEALERRGVLERDAARSKRAPGRWRLTQSG